MSEQAKPTGPQHRGDKPARPPRKRRRQRAGLVLLISVALGALVLPLLVMALTGAALQAPDWLAQRVESRLNERIGGGRVTLDRIELTVEHDLRPHVLMRNVGIFDARGAEIARLNEVGAGLAADQLLHGVVTLNNLQVSGAQITVRRARDGTFDLSSGAGNGATGTLAGVLDALDQAFAAPPLSELHAIQADELTITLEDNRSGRLWQVTGGKISLSQSDDSLDLTVAADVFNGTEELATTVIGFRTQKGSAQASLTATFENAAAADIAAQSPALAFLAVLDAPISGALRASFDEFGQIDGLAGTLDVGRGALRPTENAPPIGFDSGRAYVSFDPGEQKLTFTQVSLESEAATALAEGVAYLQDFRAGWPGTLVGQFALSKVTLQPGQIFAEPMQFAQGAVDFRLRLDPFSIDLGQVALLDGDQRFNGRGRVQVDDAGWNVALDLDLNTIPLARLLALWPVDIAKGTRDWLGRNVMNGDISNLTGAFRVQAGEKPKISLSYQYSDATVVAMATLPPIKHGAGYASLNGMAYTMSIEQGQITAPEGGTVDVAGSVFRIGDVSIIEPHAEILLATDGALTAALSLLDQPPFRIMSKAELPVDVAEGRATTRATIGFDLKQVIELPDISWSAEGELTEVASDRLIAGRQVSAERLDIRANPDQVAISGKGLLGKVPVNVTWTQALGPEANGNSALEGTIELSQGFLDEFNIALPPGSISGSGIAQIAVDLIKGRAPKFLLVSDLNRVGMALAALDWTKARNVTGTLEVAGLLGAQPSIDRLVLRAPGLSASGVIDLAPGGSLESAQFDRVTVGDWLDGPVTLTGRGANASPAVAVQGGSIDLRKAAFGSGGGSGEGGPLSLSLNRLTVSEGITLTDFRGEFKAGSGLDGRFSALVNTQAEIQGTVVPTPSGSAIRLVSDAAGGVLAASDILKNARGGRMDLTLNPTGATGVYDGRLKITDMVITKAPALTELISAISIVGLLDQMNAGGISLTEIDAEFRLTPERLTLFRSSAVGPSLGISLDGVYDLKRDRLDMQGVMSPVYFLNGIGQIFSKRGEGLFGFNFRLSGDSQAPKVGVNPLSILTPGAFREIFRRPPPTPANSE